MTKVEKTVWIFAVLAAFGGIVLYTLRGGHTVIPLIIFLVVGGAALVRIRRRANKS